MITFCPSPAVCGARSSSDIKKEKGLRSSRLCTLFACKSRQALSPLPPTPQLSCDDLCDGSLLRQYKRATTPISHQMNTPLPTKMVQLLLVSEEAAPQADIQATAVSTTITQNQDQNTIGIKAAMTEQMQ